MNKKDPNAKYYMIGIGTVVAVAFLIILVAGLMEDQEIQGRMGFYETEVKLREYPEVNLPISLIDVRLTQNETLAFYIIENNEEFWMPVEIDMFYEGSYKHFNITNDPNQPLPINGEFFIRKEHNLTATEWEDLIQIRTYLIVETQMGEKHWHLLTINKEDFNV